MLRVCHPPHRSGGIDPISCLRGCFVSAALCMVRLGPTDSTSVCQCYTHSTCDSVYFCFHTLPIQFQTWIKVIKGEKWSRQNFGLTIMLNCVRQRNFLTCQYASHITSAWLLYGVSVSILFLSEYLSVLTLYSRNDLISFLL